MRSAFAVLLCSLAASTAFAQTETLSFERQSGDVTIDIAYGDSMPVPGATVTYSFGLFSASGERLPEPYEKVHVRIFRERTELLNRTLENTGNEAPSLSFPFREAGDYSLAVVYQRPGKESVDAAFGFRVAAPSPEKGAGDIPAGRVFSPSPLIAALGAAALLLIIARVILLFRRKD